MRGNLATDTTGLVDVDEVRGGLGVDSEFTSSAGDFSGCSSVSICIQPSQWGKDEQSS